MIKEIDSLYLHFPFCAHLCNYCDFYKKVPTNKAQDYQNFHKYLEESYAVHERLIKESGYSWVPLKTLYIGGGTPSLWGKEGKIFLENFLKEKNILLDPDCEFTLEVNPGAWTDEVLNSGREFGANRFSLGIQALDQAMIKYLDRVHSLDEVFLTLDYFKKNNLNFSVDFMLGLPRSEDLNRNVIAELEKALSYGPSHFSVYILTVKDNYVHYKSLPNEEWIEKEYIEVAALLTRKGYLHYEVSNFSLPGKESQHNLNYWRTKSVAALGPSATGFLSEERLRYKWKPNSPQIEIENLSEADLQLERVYMNVRSSVGLDLQLLNKNEHALTMLLPLIERWKKNDYAFVENGFVKLTSKGYLLLDSLMSDLFSLKLL